jgi:amidohydrolase
MVIDALRAIGLEGRPGETTDSVVAVIEGARPGPTILLRADMDGLPLSEDTGLEFASENVGVMHGCGHDTHVAMLLGAARLLVERRDALGGRVLLMFQPGEEGYHGARFMIEEGLLEDGPHGAGPVARAFAIHIGTEYPADTIALRPGALLASADAIRATVRGRGGHASAPHLALDPIPTAAELVLALQAATTRSVDPFDPADQWRHDQQHHPRDRRDRGDHPDRVGGDARAHARPGRTGGGGRGRGPRHDRGAGDRAGLPGHHV